jgi:Na+/melibiose symporter-like transporter
VAWATQRKPTSSKARRFILAGAAFEVVILVLIGASAGLSGQSGYWVLFLLVLLSMLGSNTSHAATQALIPDLVPDSRKGFFSGVKAALEVPAALIFVSFVISRQVAAGDLWAALITLSGVLLVCAGVSMFVPERPGRPGPGALDWRPFLRLLVMTALFTALILVAGLGVRTVIDLAASLPQASQLWVVGAAGLAAMALTVLFGVWISVRTSFGREIDSNPSFVWWVVNRLAFLVASTNLAGFMVYLLQEKFPELAGQRAAGPASTIIMFVGVFILVMALPGGWVADRLGKRLLSALSGLAVAVGALVVVAAPSMTLIYVGACIVGAGVGFFYSANWALGSQIVPQEHAGRYLGIQNIAGAGAGAVGAYIGGAIADHHSYVLLMTLYGLMALLSILALLGIKQAD